MNGYISNLRIVKGTALYTANFTPATTTLTAVANTSLVTCQSNRFIDNSTNNFTVTRNGDVRVVALSPFNPTASWSAAVNGGSGYFDNSGDYLTAPANASLALGTGNFTLEAWVYATSAFGTDPIFESRSSSSSTAGYAWVVYSNGKMDIFNNAWLGQSSIALNLYAWNHVAVVRSGTGANQTTYYVNGAAAGTITFSANLTDGSSYETKISGSSTAGEHFGGYISNARIVKGVAVYTGAFTPPTAPITNAGLTSAASYPSTTNVNTSFASSATSLLLNFTNAGILDATSKNVLETVGDAKISTAQSKWGGSSMYFDGSGDYLFYTASPLYAMGSADFTIEFWYFPVTTSNTNPTLLGNYNTNWQSGRYGLHSPHASYPNKYSFWVNNYSTSAAMLISTTNISLNNWVHLAITRSTSTWKLFVNGTAQSTVTSTVSLDNNTGGDGFWIGANFYTGEGGRYINAYLQDLRITKFARYTTDFTPPTGSHRIK